MSASESCVWSQDTWEDCESNVYNSGCGEAFCITEGKPSENNMKFCCYCGRPMVEKPYVEPRGDDDD